MRIRQSLKASSLGVVATLPLLLLGCGRGDDQSALRSQVAELQTQAVAPDRVVGMEVRCELVTTSAGIQKEYTDAICLTGREGSLFIPPESLVNKRKVLTIRASNYSYTVSVAMDTNVALNDPWPSK